MSSEIFGHAIIGTPMSQGKELTYEQKQAIVHVKKYMDDEKGQGKSISTANPARRTAQALHFLKRCSNEMMNPLRGAYNQADKVSRSR